MCRRYQDAINRFEDILYYTRTTDSHNMYYSDYATIRSKCEHITALLALAHALQDGIVNDLCRNEADLLHKASSGDMDAASALFKKGAPKFIEPSFLAPLEDREESQEVFGENSASNASKVAMDTQLQVFLRDFKLRKNSVDIRSYLNLYESLKISKLATLLGKVCIPLPFVTMKIACMLIVSLVFVRLSMFVALNSMASERIFQWVLLIQIVI